MPKSGSDVDVEFQKTLDSGNIVHHADTIAGVQYSYGGIFKFWIDGFVRESYYDLEARAGASLNAAKLTKKYLNAQMIWLDMIAPRTKNTLTKGECYDAVVRKLSGGMVSARQYWRRRGPSKLVAVLC